MRTVVGLYERIEDAHRAIQALKNAGFDHSQINLISSDQEGRYSRYLEGREKGEDATEGAATGAGIGAVLGGLGGLLVGLGALAIPGIGPVVAAGPIAAALAGAGIGAATGGIVGALVDLGVPEGQANIYAEGIRRGGTLVTLKTEDDRSDQAVSIMNQFNPMDIERRSSEWRQENWTGFNEQAEPYQTAERTNVPVTGGDQGMDIPVIEEDIDITKREVERGEVNVRTQVDKEVEDTKETIRDTMRHQRVDIQRIGEEDWRLVEPAFRQHYQSQFGTRGRDFDYYVPAYRYGYALQRDERFHDYDWNQLEPIAHRDWESQGFDSDWYEVRDAIRYGWEQRIR